MLVQEHFKDIIRVLFWYPLRWVIQFLPRRLTMRIADYTGIILAWSAENRRSVINRELGLLFPDWSEKKRAVVTRNTFRVFLQDQCDVLLYPFLDARTTGHIAELEGIEHLDTALKGGKGAILLLCHLGSNQIILPVLGYRGYRIGQVSLPADSIDIVFQDREVTAIHRHVLQLKRRHEEMLPTEHIFLDHGIWEALSWLRQGHTLAIAVDGRHGQRFIPVNCCGRRIRLSPSPMIMHMRTSSPLLPAFTVRDGRGRHRVIIEPPLATAGPEIGSVESRINWLLQHYAKRLEAWLHRYPASYGMFLFLAATHTMNQENALFEDWLERNAGADSGCPSIDLSDIR